MYNFRKHAVAIAAGDEPIAIPQIEPDASPEEQAPPTSATDETAQYAQQQQHSADEGDYKEASGGHASYPAPPEDLERQPTSGSVDDMDITDAGDTGAPSSAGAEANVAAHHDGSQVGQLSGELQAPPPTASTTEVFAYYRALIEKHNLTPPKPWRQIRFDLPATVAELRLDPPNPVEVQYAAPIRPSPCVVLLLEGARPADMPVKEYSAKMVEYLLDLLSYQGASTAITTLRFVKKGSELAQLVVTFAKDVRLATRVLEQLQAVGLPAGFGPPIEEYPPNATFQVTDYRMSLNGGRGVSAEELQLLLAPFRASNTVDLAVIEGYEPGTFFVPVKRPETVYSFLWNPFCSFVVQSALFRRCGVLLTMALCHHEFLQKGVPYYIQKEQKKMAMERLRRQGEGGLADEHETHAGGGLAGEDEASESDNEAEVDDAREPVWAATAQAEVNIFDSAAPAGGAGGSSGAGLAFVSPSDEDAVQELLRTYHADPAVSSAAQAEPEPPAGGAHANAAHQPRPAYLPPPMMMSGHPPDTFDAAPEPAAAPYAPPPLHPELGGFPPYAAPPPPPPPSVPLPHPLYDQQQPYHHEFGSTSAAPPPAEAAKYPALVEDDDDDVDAPAHPRRRVSSTPPGELQWGSAGVPPVVAPGYRGGSSAGVLAWDAPPPPPPHGDAPGSYPPWPSPSGPPGAALPAVPHNGVLGSAPLPYSAVTAPGVPAGPSIFPSPMQAAFAAQGIASDAAPERVWPPRPSRAATEAARLATLVEELVQNAFPREVEAALAAAAARREEQLPVSSSLAAMELVPPSACVPSATVEIHELMDVLRRQRRAITSVLSTVDHERASARDRLVEALLIAPAAASEVEDWVTHSEGGHALDTRRASPAAPVEATQRAADEEGEDGGEPQLRALLPYLLTTADGSELVAMLATHAADRVAPLVARYVLPFLLDAAVVRGVCAACLRHDPTPSNPLVVRIVQHWVPLTRWLEAYIHAQAARNAQRAASREAAVARKDGAREQACAMAEKQLTSLVGNTLDLLLAGLSPAQRTACSAFSVASNAVDLFARLVDGEGDVMVASGAAAADTTSSAKGVARLWGAHGAVQRTVARLYLNADLVDGTAMALRLFTSAPPQQPTATRESPLLTRDQLYFVILALSKNLVSPHLGQQTAALCGVFLRLLEWQEPHVPDNAAVLGETEAKQLLDAALRRQPSPSVYAALREAYFAEPAPSRRFETIRAALASATPPAPPQPAAAVYASSSGHNRTTSGVVAPPAEATATAAAAVEWRAEWTAVMKRYPKQASPFTPLPHGWTSSLSRSYGHYYFRRSGANPTYRHPTDAEEFMATPQAFLAEPGVTTTLADVVAKASELAQRNAAAAEVVAESAAAWQQDQRVRNLYLDLAVMELLHIRYRTGGRERRGSGAAAAAKRTRTRSPPDEEALAARLAVLRHYPATGEPFPEVARGWTANMSSSNGLYYFRPPHGEPTYRHPRTHRSYRATPQAFVRHRALSLSAVAEAAGKALVEVEEWLTDQRYRSKEIDAAVVTIVPVHYVHVADIDDARRGSNAAGDRHRKRAAHR